MHDLKPATIFVLEKRPQETAAKAYAQTDSGDDDVDEDQHQTVSTHRSLVPMHVDFRCKFITRHFLFIVGSGSS